MVRRAQLIAKHTFPTDWTPAEITAWQEVWRAVEQAKKDLRRIVFVSGVFDLFHEEHQRFLAKAREVGNFLVVGIESDDRVRRTKGPDRPYDPQAQRLAAVLASGLVDAAAILPERFDTPAHHRALISLLRPHILAVSSHSPHQTAKAAILREFGGKLVVVHQHNPAISTTKKSQQGTIQQ